MGEYITMTLSDDGGEDEWSIFQALQSTSLKHKKLTMISLLSTIISVSEYSHSLVVNSIQGANCLEEVGSTHVVLHVGVPAVIQTLLQKENT
jgi:hypothetical protein